MTMQDFFMRDRDPGRPMDDVLSDSITPEFRVRLLELHEAIQDALVRHGSRLSIAVADGVERDADLSGSQTVLTIHDHGEKDDTQVSVSLQLANDRSIALCYPRASLRGIPSDILVWAILRDLQKELD